MKISQVFISAKCANPNPAFQMSQMSLNPHLVCARVLDTLRVSGLTYSLQETPFSATVVLRKKYIKNFSPQLNNNFMNIDEKFIPAPVTPKQESDAERDLQIVTSNLVACEAEISTLTENLTQLQLASDTKERSLNNTITHINEEIAAEVDELSKVKVQLNQHTVNSRDKIGSFHKDKLPAK